MFLLRVLFSAKVHVVNGQRLCNHFVCVSVCLSVLN